MKKKVQHLKIDIRRKKIVEHLVSNGKVSVAELSELFQVVPATIRSDLVFLQDNGMLKRVSGGAVLTVKNLYHTSFQDRIKRNAPMKQAVGEAVANLVENGETLFINAGATTLYAATAIKKKLNLNVVTNSIAVAMELGAEATHHVTLLGGEVNVQYAFTHGAIALEQLNHYTADVCILSIDGVSAISGLTTYHPDEAPVDRLMMDRARKKIIVADYSKIGYQSFLKVCEIEKASHIVTNLRAKKEEIEAIRSMGIEITLC